MKYQLQGPTCQAEARSKLLAALDGGVFPQAVLLAGPPGIGKKAMAAGLAKVICCTGTEVRPCGSCFSCRSAEDPDGAGRWVFPMELTADEAQKLEKREAATREYLAALRKTPESILHEGRNQISVHQIRHLRDSLTNRAGAVRAYVVCEADRMNEQAANAFLKTLEEAPADTYFLLTTGKRSSLLPTIRSRCLCLHLPPMPPADIEAVLRREGHDPDGLSGLVALCEGSAGRALRMAGAGFPTLQESAAQYLEMATSGRVGALLNTIAEESWMQDSGQARLFLEVLSGELRSGVLAGSLDATRGSLVAQRVQQAWERLDKSPANLVVSSLAMQISPEGSR